MQIIYIWFNPIIVQLQFDQYRLPIASIKKEDHATEFSHANDHCH